MGQATLTGSAGTITAKIGDRFRWPYWSVRAAEWEIVGFPGEYTYSPTGLGGTPTVIARHVGGELEPHEAHWTENGLCEWCGDSVATAMIKGTPA